MFKHFNSAVKSVAAVSAVGLTLALALPLTAQASDDLSPPPTEENVTLSNWMEHFPQALRSFDRVVSNMVAVNTETVQPLDVHLDADIAAMDSLQALLQQPELDSFLVLKDQQILFEHYAADKGMNAASKHSAMSSTKPMVALLLVDALRAGTIAADDKIEQHIPEIGSGYRGRSIHDLMAMNVYHQFDEDGAVLPQDAAWQQLLARDAATSGQGPAVKGFDETRLAFLASIKGAGKDESNVNETGYTYYATPNTDVAMWAIARAQGQDIRALVSAKVQQIGAEDTVLIASSAAGIPTLGGGFITTTRDLARYGMLLRDEPMLAKLAATPGTEFGLDFIDNYAFFLISYGKGYGHIGWGGQFIWTDPVTGLVVAAFSSLDYDAENTVDYYERVTGVISNIKAQYSQ